MQFPENVATLMISANADALVQARYNLKVKKWAKVKDKNKWNNNSVLELIMKHCTPNHENEAQFDGRLEKN